MRWITPALIIVIVALQYPLWVGRGGWLKVWDVDRRISEQRKINFQLKQRNRSLEAEVDDLKRGYDAIEERARYELGMIKPGETFIQYSNKGEPGTADIKNSPKKSGYIEIPPLQKPNESHP